MISISQSRGGPAGGPTAGEFPPTLISFAADWSTPSHEATCISFAALEEQLEQLDRFYRPGILPLSIAVVPPDAGEITCMTQLQVDPLR